MTLSVYRQVLLFMLFLLSPAIYAFFHQLFRGIRAEIRERKEARRDGCEYL